MAAPGASAPPPPVFPPPPSPLLLSAPVALLAGSSIFLPDNLLDKRCLTVRIIIIFLRLSAAVTPPAPALLVLLPPLLAYSPAGCIRTPPSAPLVLSPPPRSPPIFSPSTPRSTCTSLLTAHCSVRDAGCENVRFVSQYHPIVTSARPRS